VGQAHIVLTNTEQGTTREDTTNERGEYEFLALAPGVYSLHVEKVGFRRYEQKSIQLLVNLPAKQDVSLEVGTTTETIEVTAQAAAINTTDASLGIAFGENQVKQLPMEGRNVPDLLSLQAGVVYLGNRTDINRSIDTRSGSVNGARSDQSNITLDGVDVNDSGGNAFTSVLPVTLDSVQEFRVTTSNYNADQGSSSGAQVSLITKGGTNAFHGSAYEYHRNTITSANDYFIKLSQLQQGQPNEAPRLLRNIFGGSLGGPLHKDRLFFFVNYEGARQREENSAVRSVPTASLRDGVMFYACADPSQCPAGSVTGLSGASYTVPGGMKGLSPGQITAMDPLGLGPNPAMTTYFNTFPSANDASVGDGFNYTGFRFKAPIQKNYDYYIARLDYKLTSSGSHTLYWRGALSNFANPGVPYLPGEAPAHSLVNYNKGLVVGYSAVLRSNLVNSFRWGFTRESVGDIGNSQEPAIFFRGLNTDSDGVTYSRSFQRPVHNIADDISWVKGSHTLQFGTSIALIRNPRTSQTNSFSDGITNASWIDTAGFAVKSGSPFNPSNNGFPAADESFANSYDFPLIALLGMVTEVDASYNYLKDGTVLDQGAPVKRRFAADGYEFYAQDTWKIKPNFTLTYGLRYSLFSPPWEVNGQQVSPTLSLGKWFKQRGLNMAQGIPSNTDPSVEFDLAGPANGGRKGYYDWDYHNFGPRIAFAWSPKGNSGISKSLFGEGNKTSIRGGFGMVYDRIGGGLLNTFDRFGSFGLSTGLTNPAGVVSAASSPRLTDIHTIPQTDNNGDTLFLPAPPGGFPQTFPNTLDTGGFAIAWGLDDTIKTPYSYTIDFSVARELPHNFSLEVSYVGRLSHRLLIQEDLAMPLDLVDKKSGVGYFNAATALAKLYRSGVTDETFNASMLPASVVQYWTNMISPLKPGGAYAIGASPNTFGGCFNSNNPAPPTSTTDPVLAAFDLFCAGSLNETTPLFALDLFGLPDANLLDSDGNSAEFYGPSTGFNSFFNAQYSSLYAWRSASNANYHALQVNLRKRMSQGVQFDLNYTFSKSIDLASDAERISWVSGLGGQIINSWSPKQLRAVSDFDSRHQFNANWIAELPFGRGKAVGRDSGRLLDALIGGWQLSGLFRITSGFPVNVFGGFNWPTNWELGGNAFRESHLTTGSFKNPDGTVSMFKDGPAAISAFRAPFPGEAGGRNQVIGDGFFGVDLGLAKHWNMPWSEKHRLQFRWEVFNVTNTPRFNVQSNPPELDISTTFGNYTGLLTNPRVMQFALRYEF
jgi:hypothetical protein